MTHIRWYNMTRKKTHLEFVNEVFELVGNEYDVLSQYDGNKKKMSFLHKECGNVFEMVPSKFLGGQRCPIHNGERLSKAMTKTNEMVKAEFAIKRPDLTLFSEYEGNHYKIKVKGECGHYWDATPNNLLGVKSGCPSCKGLTNTDSFVFKMLEKYGTEFEVLGEYKRNTTAIKVKHNKCGHVFSRAPKRLLLHGGCPNCMQSSGEAFVDRWLYNGGFNYERQYKITNCRNINPLPFDFMVENRSGEIILIEVDGPQHFKKSNFWGGDTAKAWENIQRNDNIKNIYCINNGLKLLRLPYWWFRNDRASNELKKALQ